jgi:hypothetical protein
VEECQKKHADLPQKLKWKRNWSCTWKNNLNVNRKPTLCENGIQNSEIPGRSKAAIIKRNISVHDMGSTSPEIAIAADENGGFLLEEICYYPITPNLKLRRNSQNIPYILIFRNETHQGCIVCMVISYCLRSVTNLMPQTFHVLHIFTCWSGWYMYWQGNAEGSCRCSFPSYVVLTVFMFHLYHTRITCFGFLTSPLASPSQSP